MEILGYGMWIFISMALACAIRLGLNEKTESVLLILFIPVFIGVMMIIMPIAFLRS